MNMALLGLSLILVSLSCLIYHSPLSTWRSTWQRLRIWNHDQLPLLTEEEKHTKLSTADHQREVEDDKVEKSAPLRHDVPIIIPTQVNEVSSGSRSTRSATSPSRRKSSGEESNSPDASTSPTRQIVPRALKAPSTHPEINLPEGDTVHATLTALQAMAPPPRPVAPFARQAPSSPSTQNTLRITTTGPLPNRGPPASSAARSSSSTTLLAPSTSTLPPPGRPRQKVILKPGHSPLDWAQLTRTHPNLAGVPHLQRVTPALLAHNNGRKGKPAWSLFRGRVYNISPYLPFHPGGEGELMRGAGKDAEKMFLEVHPWVNWENMLGGCMVGIMVGEGEGMVWPLAGLSALDEMD